MRRVIAEDSSVSLLERTAVEDSSVSLLERTGVEDSSVSLLERTAEAISGANGITRRRRFHDDVAPSFSMQVPIILGQVHPINDALSAEDAAKDYESSLRELVKSRILSVSDTSSGFPRFDLVLLGMGSVDGHVASLFPSHPLTHEKKKWIAPITNSPKPPPHRITFTFPLINSAANVAMVLPETNISKVLAKAFGKELSPGLLPVQMVAPTEGKLVWFLVDKKASAKL